MSLSNIPQHVLFEALRNDPVNKLMVVMKALNYGWLGLDGKVYTPDNWSTPEDPDGGQAWWHTYKVMSPKEVWKHKVGTCIDQTIFAQDWLSRHAPHLKTKICHIQVYGSNNHMWVVFEQDGKWHWIENAWQSYRAIHGPYNKPIDSVHQFYKWQEGPKTGYRYKIMDEFPYRPNMDAVAYCKAVDFNFNKSPWKKINGKWVDTEA